MPFPAVPKGQGKGSLGIYSVARWIERNRFLEIDSVGASILGQQVSGQPFTAATPSPEIQPPAKPDRIHGCPPADFGIVIPRPEPYQTGLGII